MGTGNFSIANAVLLYDFALNEFSPCISINLLSNENASASWLLLIISKNRSSCKSDVNEAIGGKKEKNFLAEVSHGHWVRLF